MCSKVKHMRMDEMVKKKKVAIYLGFFVKYIVRKSNIVIVKESLGRLLKGDCFTISNMIEG